MEQKIEDYLHFYLSQEVCVSVWSKAFNIKLILAPEYKIGTLISINTYESFPCTVSTKGEGRTDFRYAHIKLILRPISDLKQGEIIDGGFSSHWKEIDIKNIIQNRLMPSQFVYLLNQGFDLFGLIESGLAIDRTTLPIK